MRLGLYPNEVRRTKAPHTAIPLQILENAVGREDLLDTHRTKGSIPLLIAYFGGININP